MKLTSDIDYSVWPRTALKLLSVSAAIAIAGIAFAGPQKFNSGDTLTAAELNGNFQDLDGRTSALESSVAALKGPTVLKATGTTIETAAPDADFVYQGASVTLTPGTWTLQASASVFTKLNQDAVQIAFWDDTNAVEVPDSRSSFATTVGIGGTGCSGNGGNCGSVQATTFATIAVTASTMIKIKAFRNGASQVGIGGVINNPLQVANRIMATKLGD